jgi:hypothetical protein
MCYKIVKIKQHSPWQINSQKYGKHYLAKSCIVCTH